MMPDTSQANSFNWRCCHHRQWGVEGVWFCIISAYILNYLEGKERQIDELRVWNQVEQISTQCQDTEWQSDSSVICITPPGSGYGNLLQVLIDNRLKHWLWILLRIYMEICAVILFKWLSVESKQIVVGGQLGSAGQNYSFSYTSWGPNISIYCKEEVRKLYEPYEPGTQVIWCLWKSVHEGILFKSLKWHIHLHASLFTIFFTGAEKNVFRYFYFVALLNTVLAGSFPIFPWLIQSETSDLYCWSC